MGTDTSSVYDEEACRAFIEKQKAAFKGA